MEVAGLEEIGIAEVGLGMLAYKAGAIVADHWQKEAAVEMDMKVDNLVVDDPVVAS
jgi:hypothetical protein